VSVTAYHSFGGEVEALNTPTIRRLTPSCRHQLPHIAPGVWTADGSRALRVGRKIRVGQLYINSYGAGGGIELPFGGTKKSGHGREKGFEALYEVASMKTLVIKHG